ncbi:hypothetical protein [Streptomyces zagrosensis]|uniref:Putative membrane protein n=1 Tax=Streptomyces zagrosensis TaxID=1042984 RepID=A0A7W9QEN8_9ACTN|nr:hypothetical protein [Streptomyces zagrosensis]MBB5938751.1 putative membrane protein [Streptomyces zagrosensis]
MMVSSVVLSALVAASSVSVAQAAPESSVTARNAGKVMRELPLPAGDLVSTAAFMNDAGQIVGTTDDGRGHYHPVRWEADRSITHLATLNGPTHPGTKALAADGTVAGSAATPDGHEHAVTWGGAGALMRLEEPTGFADSVANDINDHHVAVGSVSVNSTTRPVRWGADGKATMLDMLLHMTHSQATHVNDRGEIFGWASQYNAKHAVRWDLSGQVTDLGNLGGTWGEVRGVNDRGTVVGSAGALNGDTLAARAWPAQTFHALAGARQSSGAIAVNNSDVAIGGIGYDAVQWQGNELIPLRPMPDVRDTKVHSLNEAGTSTGASGKYAVTWDATGQPTELPVEPSTRSAYGWVINGPGHVLGYAQRWGEGRRAVVWS